MTLRYVLGNLLDGVLMGTPQRLERNRLAVLGHTLQHLNLQPAPEGVPRPPLSPLPQFLVSLPTPQHGPPSQNVLAGLRPGVVSGGYETFAFRSLSGVTRPDWTVIRERATHHRETAPGDHRIWVLCPGELPDQQFYTPYFDLARYFDSLGSARGHQLPKNLVGNDVLYGEAVTSTQTQLTK